MPRQTHDEKMESEAKRAERRVVSPNQGYPIERIWELPRKWTFQMPKVRAWVQERLTGDVLNLFGGVVWLAPPYTGGYVHNDLDPNIDSHESRDAYDLTSWQSMQAQFDTVVFDPPYTAYQAVRTYGAKKAQEVSHARDVVEYVLRPAGRVISLGFNSTGMSESRGFEKEGLLYVNGGGSHNDICVMSERRQT